MKISRVLLVSFLMISAFANNKVLYGTDDRVESNSYGDTRFREFAKSVAGRVGNGLLETDQYNPENDSFLVVGPTLSEGMQVCSHERFAEQKIYVDCTGFLIADDILVTAGHCVQGKRDCRNNSWVFGYTEGVSEIPASQIYGCEEILAQEMKYSVLGSLIIDSDKDYAVIKLDRKVENAKPLKIRRKGKVKKGTDLVVIGHPSGLPMKTANNAKVVKTWGKSFKTNLDTYGGNSGSPVFNSKTGEVEGILTQGENDYDYGQYCSQSASAEGHNERVYKITKIPYIKKMIKEGKL
jgi:V8-like Glu-specific endopeptidase